MDKTITFTLVHGTWARNAEWTKPESPLFKALRRNFPNVEIKTLPWSSWNRFSARDNARSDLKKRIRNAQNTQHFIIAHSHGGNIARDAVRDQEELVGGLICLNTPFFTTLTRETAFIFEMVIAYAGITFTWAVAAALTNYGLHWLAALGLAVLAFALLKIPIEKTEVWAVNRGTYLRNKLEPPALRKTRFLCLTSPEDEAYGWLSFFEGLANLPFLLMGAWTLPIVWVLTLALLATGVLPILSAPWELWDSAISTTDGWQKWGLFILMSFYFSGLFFVAIFVLAGICSVVLVAVPYGNLRFLDANLFLRVLVTLTPASSSLVEFYERKVSGEGLKHSLLYQDEEAIDFVVAWIRSVAEVPESNAQQIAAEDAP
jgi:pimeloyl-ACP methyl ester carboxylesterase